MPSCKTSLQQEHIRVFGLYLASCNFFYGKVLGLRLMMFSESTRTQVQTRMQIQKRLWHHF